MIPIWVTMTSLLQPLETQKFEEYGAGRTFGDKPRTISWILKLEKKPVWECNSHMHNSIQWLTAQMWALCVVGWLMMTELGIRVATGHFGPGQIGTETTSALFRWVWSVRTFRHQYQSVQPTVQTVPPYGPNSPTLWSEVSHPNFVV